MSDQAQGPGWWLASDGRWYPPEARALSPQPARTGPPPTPRWLKSVGWAAAFFAGLFVILAAIAAIAGPSKKPVHVATEAPTTRAAPPSTTTTTKPAPKPAVVTTTTTTTPKPPPTAPIATSVVGDSGHVSKADLAAFDVCKQFVTDQLKAPLGAVWRDPTGNQVHYFGPGVDNEITVDASVDSQNSFGAKIRSTYECSVTPAGGGRWTLQDLQISP